MPSLTRREFLYYLWGASAAVLTTEAVGFGLWSALPYGSASGECFDFCETLRVWQLPPPDGEPLRVLHPQRPGEGFWLVHLGPEALAAPGRPARAPQHPGLLAFRAQCQRGDCWYMWNKANQTFSCPCDGATFAKDGTWQSGPADRDMDQFRLTVFNRAGEKIARTEAGEPVALAPEAALVGVATMFFFRGLKVE